ncbi:MAG: scyllo-inositol 2-dehydrogenase [Chloroflexota bacterium]|nr:scyllo-inositol 2-dehydrogenase [Chloroflexota bacterium]
MSERVRIGVVGAGRMGSIHARLIARHVHEAHLAGIADLNVHAARHLAGELGDPPVFPSLEDMLAAGNIDAVLIAVSSNGHLDAIRTAAAAGRDILCEKPIALTMADTLAAIHDADAAKVRLQVGFMRRWDMDYARAKARLGSGALGRPILFKSLQFDAEPPPVSFADPAVSGGIMVDMGIHEFDLARWLMDDEVVEVQAYGSSVAHPSMATVGDVDSAVVNLHFAGGTTGTVELARNTTYGEDVRTEVLATAGSVWIGHLPVSHGSWSGGGAGASVAADLADVAVPRFEAAFAAQTRGFAQAILDGRPVEVPATAGAAALAIALAADRSMREGRPVAV